MSKRTDNEIKIQILTVAISGATKTEIMFKAFLTHNQFSSYISCLTEAEMIIYQKVEGLFRTSEIGLDYLGTQATTSTGRTSDKVLVIGLGQLGLPVAKYVKDRGGFDVYGYDISTKAIDRAQKIAVIKRIRDTNSNHNSITNNNPLTNYDFSEFDVFIICVSTHKPDDMFSPQIDGLLSIVEKISKEAKNAALVCSRTGRTWCQSTTSTGWSMSMLSRCSNAIL